MIVIFYIGNVSTNKPSDKVVAYLVTVGPVLPAEFSHLIAKSYCFPGLKSFTVSCVVAVSAVNSFPLSKLYLTIYFTLPTLTLVQPLKVNTTDLAVTVLLSIDTLGLGGSVWRH